MKISNLIKILAEYQIEHGDLKVMFGYTDKYTKSLAIDEIDEMDLNIHELTSQRILLYKPDQVNED